MKINREAKVFSNPVATAVFTATLAASGYLAYLMYPLTGPMIVVAAAGMALAFFLATAIRIADQWEKAVVLRMGKYRGLKGPGFFLIIPIIDQVDSYIDQRLRVTDTGRAVATESAAVLWTGAAISVLLVLLVAYSNITSVVHGDRKSGG